MTNRRGCRKEIGQEEDHRITAFPLRVGCTAQYRDLDSGPLPVCTHSS
jgi:hypothetical protein